MLVQETTTTSNYQVLPPEYQKAREIEKILQDPLFVKTIGNACYKIHQVKGGYLVVTDFCVMMVDVEHLPPSQGGIIGEPTRFELHFNEPIIFND